VDHRQPPAALAVAGTCWARPFPASTASST